MIRNPMNLNLRHNAKHPIRLIPIALLLLLAACSLADFAYDYAPRIAVRYADDYLQLNNRQAEHALGLFRERHVLHAEDELPRYYRFLVATESVVSDGVERDDVDAIFDEAQSLFRLGVERTIPALAEILAGLDEDQLNALQARLRDDAEEDRERIAEDHESRRRKKALEEFEEWVGELHASQKEMILAEMDKARETRPLWLNWRVSRNQQLISLLRERPDREAIQAFLVDYWIHRKGMPEELLSGMDENRERYRDTIVAFDKSLTKKQRSTARDKLAEYRDMVLDMMPDEVRVAVLEEQAASEQQASP